MKTVTILMASVLVTLAFMAAPGLAQSRPALVEDQGWADMIVVNGKVVSMDDRSTTPDKPGRIYAAMAIKGKRIMALGTDAEIRALAGSKTEVMDVGGKTVIPGLVATHFHLFSPAASRYGASQGLVDPSVKLTVESDKDPESTAKKIRDTVVNAIQVQKIPKGQWITVNLRENRTNAPGTTRDWFFRHKINRRQFDNAIKDNPLLINAGVNGAFNTVAIELFKKDFPDWEESVDLENGEGAAREGYAMVPEIGAIGFEFWWKDEPVEKLAEAMRLEGLDIIRAGVTTVATRILYPKVIAAFNHLNRAGTMPHRLAYYVESQRGNFFDIKAVRQFYRATGANWTDHRNGGEMLWLNGMCNEIWDASSNEVCMGPDVPASAEIKSRERCPGPGSRPWESYKAAILNGWRPVQAHSTSSHGARLFLKMLDETREEGKFSVEYIKNLRPAIEHNQLLGSKPDVMAGIKKYGIILNINTGYLSGMPSIIKDYGPQLEEFVQPVKTWLDQGIRVTFEADGTNFWRPIYRLVTRKIQVSGQKDPVVLRPDQAIDRVTALKMGTTWASEYMMAEDTVGTLEVGKFADFDVLDKDFFTIPVAEIPSIKVLQVGLNGKIVADNVKNPPPAAPAGEFQPDL